MHGGDGGVHTLAGVWDGKGIFASVYLPSGSATLLRDYSTHHTSRSELC